MDNSIDELTNLGYSSSAKRVRLNIKELRTVESESRLKWWTRKRRRIALGILGSSVCGILIAVAIVIPISMNQKSTQTTSATSTTTSVALPAQCSSYTMITDATRLATGGAPTIICDNILFTATPVWIRFSGSAGTMLVNYAPTTYRCNTHAPGWYTGSLPAVGSTVSGTVCYNWSGNTCNWSNSISVTNCNGFYLYRLIAPPVCSLRYCTM
ncbi:hypothetical protein I4U23_021655 [Adineta vaga]|nr:hypothetical protein I4U23_021655 [Adineta vaga]